MATKGEDIKWFQEQKEHALHRPDMYIGACSVQSSDGEWVYNSEDKEMYFKEVKYTPGLLKIFNEVVDNARDASISDKTVTQIKVTIDKESGKISVWNNGAGIEVKKHEEYGLYNQEIIFGELNSGANYNDDSERLVGGLNGLGVKLTSIFSTQFGVECADGFKKFTQVYKNNMKTKSKPKVASSKVKPYVKVVFIPDWTRFGYTLMTNDMYDLFATSVIHTAATTDKRVSVYLNGKSVGVKDFEKFMDLYIGSDKKENPRMFYSSPRWKVGLSISDSYQHESFVNGIHTRDGGTHVKYITSQIVKGVKEALSKKKETKNSKINNSYIEQNLFVFVSCIVNQPSFDSQTKNALNTKSALFGSTCKIPDKFIDDFVKKTDIVSRIAGIANAKELKDLDKISGKKKSNIRIDKLVDANLAGTKKSNECMLFVVEGLSAKTFVTHGYPVIGKEKYGVFPLKGKLKNIRDEKTKNTILLENKEIKNIVEILGLQYSKKYTNLNDLRYGRICILTDADKDGTHIKGLIINFIDNIWPELFKLGFVCTFNTPIVKATKGKKGKKSQCHIFYTESEFENWNKNENKNKTWTIKYYKGLGTSDPAEARECFKSLHENITVYDPDKHGRACIDMAFNKKKADTRKVWIQNFDKEKQVIKKLQANLGLSDFINKELIWFSNASVIRSVPSLVDGLKPSQRKIIWLGLNIPNFTNSSNEMKVPVYSGKITSDMAYHHGEVSASNTIISMAQDFVGSNNINLLVPAGSFGTRIEGGKDASSPRYISTYLNTASKVIFDPNDNKILNMLEDDGKQIEPEYLVPIIPMILVNGSKGIGTGFSTNISCYNPDDIKSNLVRIMKGQELVEMVPWYRGFKGTMVKNGGGNYESVGIFKKINKNTIVVTELPIGTWTDDYKKFLEKLSDNGELTFKDTGVTEFTVKLNKNIDEYEDLYKYLKLISGGLQTSNMYLFNSEGKIQKYDSPLDIIKEFYDIRLAFYEKRKKYMCSVIKKECLLLDEKARFIKMVSENQITVFKQKKSVVVEQLKENGFKRIESLLDLKIHLFTDEKIKELVGQCKIKKEELVELEGTPIKVMWAKNLGELV